VTTTFTKLSPNLVRNGRVDTLDDYTASIGGTGGAGSIQRVTGTPPAGYSAYARSVVTTAPTSGTRYVDVRNIGTATNLVTPGQSYDLGMIVRGNFTGDDIAYMQWLDAGAAVISTVQTPSVNPGSGSWEDLELPGLVAPAGAVRGLIFRRRVPTSGTLAVNNYADVTGLWLRLTPGSSDIVVPILLTGYETTREAGGIVHRIANSNTNRATLRPAGPRSGTLELLVEDAAAAAVAAGRFSSANAWRVVDDETPEINMTFVITGGDITTQLDDETRVRWLVRVPFEEVPAA
jgi:hypothetical protein